MPLLTSSQILLISAFGAGALSTALMIDLLDKREGATKCKTSEKDPMKKEGTLYTLGPREEQDV